jgi:hypothetical protein
MPRPSHPPCFDHPNKQPGKLLHVVTISNDTFNFSTDGIINFHNNQLWAEENPHGVVQSRHQQQFSINVWACTVGGYMVCLHVLPHRLTGKKYQDFLENEVPSLLDDVPLAR